MHREHTETPTNTDISISLSFFLYHYANGKQTNSQLDKILVARGLAAVAPVAITTKNKGTSHFHQRQQKVCTQLSKNRTR